jgi:light-regulated signal transduction histidine kinase (bacteriophytochrome)
MDIGDPRPAGPALRAGARARRRGGVEHASEVERPNGQRQREIGELRRAEAELRALNGELERRLTECTAQLEATAGELQELGFSISHDLRAPLRSVKSFSQILLEEHSGTLDGQGRECLVRVSAAADRMSQLLDGLLELSRLNGGPLRRDKVNLSRLAEDITCDLRRAHPERNVEVAIQESLFATGDERLLRIALSNMLGNAWKFTGERPRARIEVGALPGEDADQRPGTPVFYVRDDGVGFDMAHAARLFGPFQRLHGRDQFEGNGLGLAMVRRIVHRHGGRAWAEGAVNGGATFYFTL